VRNNSKLTPPTSTRLKTQASTPTDLQLHQATEIVTHPETYADQMGLRTIAWHNLKAARGQTMRQSNLPRTWCQRGGSVTLKIVDRAA